MFNFFKNRDKNKAVDNIETEKSNQDNLYSDTENAPENIQDHHNIDAEYLRSEFGTEVDAYVTEENDTEPDSYEESEEIYVTEGNDNDNDNVTRFISYNKENTVSHKEDLDENTLDENTLDVDELVAEEGVSLPYTDEVDTDIVDTDEVDTEEVDPEEVDTDIVDTDEVDTDIIDDIFALDDVNENDELDDLLSADEVEINNPDEVQSTENSESVYDNTSVETIAEDHEMSGDSVIEDNYNVSEEEYFNDDILLLVNKDDQKLKERISELITSDEKVYLIDMTSNKNGIKSVPDNIKRSFVTLEGEEENFQPTDITYLISNDSKENNSIIVVTGIDDITERIKSELSDNKVAFEIIKERVLQVVEEARENNTCLLYTSDAADDSTEV